MLLFFLRIYKYIYIFHDSSIIGSISKFLTTTSAHGALYYNLNVALLRIDKNGPLGFTKLLLLVTKNLGWGKEEHYVFLLLEVAKVIFDGVDCWSNFLYLRK